MTDILNINRMINIINIDNKGKLIRGYLLSNGQSIYINEPLKYQDPKPNPLYYGQKYKL